MAHGPCKPMLLRSRGGAGGAVARSREFVRAGVHSRWKPPGMIVWGI